MLDLTCTLGPDSAGSLLTHRIRSARRSLDAAVYEVGPSYRWLFVDAARRGVLTRLLLDAHRSDGNAGTAEAVIAAGGACRVLGSDARAAHWKFVIADGSAVAVGTGNLIARDAPRPPPGSRPGEARLLAGTREWWLIADGRRLAARDVFEHAWRCATSPPVSWRAASDVAPEAAVGSPVPQVPPLRVRVRRRHVRFVTGGGEVRTALREVIRSASSRAWATVPYVHAHVDAVQELLDLLQTSRRRGADVRLLLGAPPVASDARGLRGAGFPVRVMDPTRSTRGHAKGVVTDGTVVVSSANWSAAGLGGNWEAALVAEHRGAAAYYAAAFSRDWDASAPLEFGASQARIPSKSYGT